ncbi:MAG: CPBP family intramembrane metalloprotease [Methanosarcinales archaeon]|nr:CPBP family intramembrane metalloprotease [Methanosarcinales archaeon]
MDIRQLQGLGADLVLPIILVCVAELLLFAGHLKAAVSVHALVLVLLALLFAYHGDRSYQALMLLPLFRLLNIAMPVFFSLTLYSYALIYAPMLVSLAVILRYGIFTAQEVGLSLRGLVHYLPLGAALGLLLGWMEYQVIRPEMLTPDSSLKSLVLLSVVMIIFVGLVEEFVFRSALQTVLEIRWGTPLGLLISSALFAVMHSGYHMALELLFVFFAGMTFGLLFLWTRSLPTIAISHGVTNVSLFMIAPLYDSRGLLALYLAATTAALLLATMHGGKSRVSI